MRFVPRTFSLRALLVFMAASLVVVGYLSNAAKTVQAEQAALIELYDADKIDIVYGTGRRLPSVFAIRDG